MITRPLMSVVLTWVLLTASAMNLGNPQLQTRKKLKISVAERIFPMVGSAHITELLQSALTLGSFSEPR